mgnify:FL=1
MRRVKRVYYLSIAFHPAAVKAYAGVVLLLGVLSLVSVMDIIANIATIGISSALFSYVASAFVHTELSVQAALMAFAIIAVLLIRDIERISGRVAVAQ